MVKMMLKDDKKCTICSGDMEEGFLLDFNWNSQHPARWVKGEPEKTTLGATAYTDRTNYRVHSLRCTKCGHLEFFATELVTKPQIQG
jgi:hypothetical protein